MIAKVTIKKTNPLVRTATAPVTRAGPDDPVGSVNGTGASGATGLCGNTAFRDGYKETLPEARAFEAPPAFPGYLQTPSQMTIPAGTDLETLAKHAGGLIGFTGCLASLVPYHLMHDREDEARRACGRFVEIDADMDQPSCPTCASSLVVVDVSEIHSDDATGEEKYAPRVQQGGTIPLPRE